MKINDTVDNVGNESQMLSVSADSTSATFFSARRVYQYLIVENTTANACQISGGTTLNGTDLFSSVTIPASNMTAIALDKVTIAAAAFYVNDAGVGDTWNGAILNIKTISRST
jgi:hypothetical protein